MGYSFNLQQRDREWQHQDGCSSLLSGCQDLPVPAWTTEWGSRLQQRRDPCNRGVTRGVLIPRMGCSDHRNGVGTDKKNKVLCLAVTFDATVLGVWQKLSGPALVNYIKAWPRRRGRGWESGLNLSVGSKEERGKKRRSSSFSNIRFTPNIPFFLYNRLLLRSAQNLTFESQVIGVTD